MEGTYRLPEAQMDRFLFKIDVGYPSHEEEILIIKNKHSLKVENELDQIDAILDEADIKKHRSLLSSIVIEEKLFRFIVEIVQRSRTYNDIEIGASPRASIALMTGSKALAMLRGRDFVTPDDIIDLTLPVLSHRITILPEREMEGITAREIIRTMIKTIEVPR